MSRPRSGAMLEREQKDALIMQLIEAGHTLPEVARMMRSSGKPCTPKYAQKVLHRELLEARQRRRDMGDGVFDLKLKQLDQILKSNWTVLTAPCVRCSGRGHMGQDPDKAEGTMLVCDRCKGDMKLHSPRDRATASKEVRQAIDQQCRLLGLYAPEKFSLLSDKEGELDFTDELELMDGQELERQFQMYLRAIDHEKQVQAKRVPD
jgi:hypothetical protein